MCSFYKITLTKILNVALQLWWNQDRNTKVMCKVTLGEGETDCVWICTLASGRLDSHHDRLCAATP
jgi:hypothetical protein